MHVKQDLPAGMKTRVIVRADQDGTQVITNDQGEELIELTPIDPKVGTDDPPKEAGLTMEQLLANFLALHPEHTTKRGKVASYHSPTKGVHQESKARRKMARRSRKINRKR